MPQSRFCSAKASANTSRPQPFADDIGVRKKPIDERGPNPINAIRHPHTMITAGVRQVMALARKTWLMEIALVARQGGAPAIRRAPGVEAPMNSSDRIDLNFAWLAARAGLAIGGCPCYI